MTFDGHVPEPKETMVVPADTRQALGWEWWVLGGVCLAGVLIWIIPGASSYLGDWLRSLLSKLI